MRLFSLTQNIKYYLHSGHQRTVAAKKNIISSFLLKGVSVLTSFIAVPLTINYLNPSNYGIWLTIYSVISWFGLLDIGLGNGLRNKFAESIAQQEHHKARIYVSTAYALLTIIMSIATIVFLWANNYIDWCQFLNLEPSLLDDIRKMIAIVFGFFCMQLIVKLIISILLADQKSALAGAISTITNVISLIITYALTKFSTGSLINLGIAIGTVNLFVPLVFGWYFFKTKYQNYTPSFKYINFNYAKDLVNVGFMFFLFQSTALIVVATDNVLITKLINSTSVTPYNIALKYLSPITIFFGLLSAPLWSAYTEAFIKKDFEWIRKITSKMMKVWLYLCIGTIFIIIVSPWAYKIWIGSKSELPDYSLTIWAAVYILVSCWNQIFGNFINGVSKMRLAFYLTIITAIANIPLCYLFTSYFELGLIGIIIASSVSLLPDLIFLPIQYYKIINNKATGIWDK
jgi:O-antigen/teichoic acid export membrane protein